MIAAELQQSIGTDDSAQSVSNEPTNVHSIAQRPAASSTSTAIDKRPAATARIPPPAPSPPSHPSRSPFKTQAPVAQHRPTNMTSKGIESQNQWIFTDEEVHNSPSVYDGLSFSEEVSRRAKGVNFITQAGIMLKIPQLTLGTASVFFHRFYMRYSMVPEKGGIHHYNIAATALFLATKAEENCRKTKEIVIAVVKVAQKNASLIIDEQSKEFWRWKDSILLYEETMLELLTFDVVLESPYNCLYNFLKELQIDSHKPMRNVAWAFLNDSSMTILCLLMTPRDIAVASIYFSARYNNERLPDDQDGASWWVHLNGVPAKITQAINVMADFYTENPLQKRDNPYERSPGSGGEDLEKTRLRAESHSPIYGPPTTDRDDMEEENHLERTTNGTGNHVEENMKREDDADEGEIKTKAGDDDSKLKAIANNPETHEPRLIENRVLNGFAAAERNEERKEEDDFTAAPVDGVDLGLALGQKRKREADENDQEESEEGEVEE